MQVSWRKCSRCKNDIALGGKYYVCSVSTCNGQRTGYVFCSIPCWESHVPGAKHRDAAAVEKWAPKTLENENQAGRRIVVAATSNNAAFSLQRSKESDKLPKEILIVASKLKAYVKAKSEMNTSDAVMEILSEKVRQLADGAIESARREGRKTVMDRDF